MPPDRLQWYYRKVRFSTVVGPMDPENNTYIMRCDTILWVWEEGEKIPRGQNIATWNENSEPGHVRFGGVVRTRPDEIISGCPPWDVLLWGIV